MELETARLMIRPSIFGDYIGYYEIYRDAETAFFSGVRKMDNLFDAEQLVVHLVVDHRVTVFSAFVKDGNRLVGTISVTGVEQGQGLEFGYAIHKDFRRVGIGYEAVKALMDYYRDHYVAQFFQAVIKRDNVASQKLLEKLSFAYQGPFLNSPDAYLYRRKIT